ncbi:MAG: class I fructose-bisphosphate aldolase, partial [Patescibacteria group bacterium]
AESLRENASRMAAYAEDVLAEGMVPIIEPEVLRDGNHTAHDAEVTLTETLAVVIDALGARDINLSHIIIKSAMAVSGAECAVQAPTTEVAERTVRAFTASIPETVGGVVFLSGGQSPEEATRNLNAIARMEPLPWPITFSYSRALQHEPMSVWRGDEARLADAQAEFLERLTLVANADAAAYSPGQEETAL